MLLVLCCILLGGEMTRGDQGKSYSVEIDNFDISTEYDQKYVNWDTLGLKKVGRNKFAVGGTFVLNRNLADEQKINIQLYPYNKDSQIKGPIVFNTEKHICKFIATDETYSGLREKSNLPSPDTCPIPKNEYTIEDYVFNVDFLGDNVPHGDYLLVFLLKNGLTPVAGFTASITIQD